MIDIETQLRSYQHATNIRGDTRTMCGRAADEIVRLRDIRTLLLKALSFATSGQEEPSVGLLEAPVTTALKAREEIERLRAWKDNHPYSELDMDMHVEAVTKELRAALTEIAALRREDMAMADGSPEDNLAAHYARRALEQDAPK